MPRTQRDLFRKRSKPVHGQSEHVEQVMFCQWMQFQHPHMAKRLFAVPNGEYRTISAARRLKDEGVRRGVSDLIMLVPNERYFGLCLEFKRAEETWSAVSMDQRDFLYQAEKDGYAAGVAFGFDHGRYLMTRYLNGEDVTMDDCKFYAKEKGKR
jgi:hypothetical protein